jgi:hypothetical protein
VTNAASDQQEVKLIEEKIDALMRAISEHFLPLVQALRQGPNAEQAFDSAYAVESVEKIVRLEAACDAGIAKALARLVGLKEFKRTPALGRRRRRLPVPLAGRPSSTNSCIVLGTTSMACRILERRVTATSAPST